MDEATLIFCPSESERAQYTGWLRASGFPVVEAASPADAIAYHRRESIPLTVAELLSTSFNGLELMRSVRDLRPQAEFVMLSNGESVKAAVAAMKAGVSDLLVKPVSRDVLIDVVRNVRGLVEVYAESQHFGEELRRRCDFSEIIAHSPKMLKVLAIVARVAPRDTAVLITGESGTGKELIARAIHRNSGRGGQPLVCVNCAAIPEALLESELFGYRKGAFTGADVDKPGLLTTADGGTLFLDEVAELPLATQAKLLRFIQEATFSPLGSLFPQRADVRLISATNASLAERVEAGHFRRDLYYRLSVFPIELPPLRERLEDIVPLAQHFLRLMQNGSGTRAPGLSREVVHYLTAKSWRGNVRELQSHIERAVIMSEGSLLTSADFRILDRTAGRTPLVRRNWMELPEEGIDLSALNRNLIGAALTRSQYNVSAAARLLGLTRAALRYRMKKFDIDTDGG